MVLAFFTKSEIPKITNPKLLQAIGEVKSSRTKLDALQTAFQIIVRKYTGARFHTYLYFWRAFEVDPNVLWKRSGFLHCVQQNMMLRVLLRESGWFSEAEIQLGFSLIWYLSPHQYLKVLVNNRWIALDPWNFSYGSPFGTYAQGFGHKIIV